MVILHTLCHKTIFSFRRVIWLLTQWFKLIFYSCYVNVEWQERNTITAVMYAL